jgi:hypothetical protein
MSVVTSRLPLRGIRAITRFFAQLRRISPVFARSALWLLLAARPDRRAKLHIA